MHRKILSEEKIFGEFYVDTFLWLSKWYIYTSVSENDNSSEYSSDSDHVNIRPTKRQKILVVDSDMQSESKTHGAGECSFTSTEEWIEDNISRKLEDFTGMSGVTLECNNPQSVREITELIFGNNFFKFVASQTNSYQQQKEKLYI